LGVFLFAVRLCALIVWIFLGLLCVTVFYPFARAATRCAVTRRWSGALMFLCGIKIRIQGRPALDAPALWVANHVSWADIFVLNSVRCVSFISKSDVRAWPVIGWLVAGAGTVFLDRGQRHAVRGVSQQMRERFARGEVVGLFPEGTSSSGLDVAPFHSSLFDAAIRADVDIQPVALRFMHKGRRSDYVSFVGDQTLVRNLWLLLRTTGVVVQAEFLPVMANDVCRGMGRVKTAERARALIRAAVTRP